MTEEFYEESIATNNNQGNNRDGIDFGMLMINLIFTGTLAFMILIFVGSYYGVYLR